MSKKDYYEENKNIISNKIKEYYKNDILNTLKKLVQELSKDKYKYLTEHYQKKYKENNPLTEDKKQKMKEYQKEYRKNKKELIQERANNKYKSLTEDKKQKIKDYQKQYRENNPLTKDKKQKMKEYQKEYRKNISDEQKQKIKDYQK